MSQSQPILIAGPTASGKSALALVLAEKLNGVVINADSMQVYRELRIMTARPSESDEARVPHALYGHGPASEPYSVGRFVKDASETVAYARREGRVPIFVGGTGLYFKALLEGLSPIPDIDPKVRAHWREQGERLGAGELHTQLAARDAVTAAKLKPTDTQRVVRALEVLESSGRPLADWQSEKGTPVIDDAAARKIVLRPQREMLQTRANARFLAMIDNGAIDEVRALGALSLNPSLPAMRALGVKPLMEFIAGRLSKEEAVAQGQLETRQYIKRQETWLSSNMITWKALDKQLNYNNISDIVSFIQS